MICDIISHSGKGSVCRRTLVNGTSSRYESLNSFQCWPLEDKPKAKRKFLQMGEAHAPVNSDHDPTLPLPHRPLAAPAGP